MWGIRVVLQSTGCFYAPFLFKYLNKVGLMRTVARIPIYTSMVISAATWTMLLPARLRDHLLIKYEGTNFQQYLRKPGTPEPSAATDGTLINSDYKGDFLTPELIWCGEVWVYVAGGATINARELFANDVAPVI